MQISWDKTFLRERKVQFKQDSLVHQYSRRSFALIKHQYGHREVM